MGMQGSALCGDARFLLQQLEPALMSSQPALLVQDHPSVLTLLNGAFQRVKPFP